GVRKLALRRQVLLHPAKEAADFTFETCHANAACLEKLVQLAVLFRVMGFLADKAAHCLLQFRIGDLVLIVAHRINKEALARREAGRQRRQQQGLGRVVVPPVARQVFRKLEIRLAHLGDHAHGGTCRRATLARWRGLLLNQLGTGSGSGSGVSHGILSFCFRMLSGPQGTGRRGTDVRFCADIVLVIGGQLSILPSTAQLGALPAWTRLRNQPSTYPRVFVDVAGERGIGRAQVLATAGLPGDLFDDPAGKLSLQESWQLFAAVLELVDDPAFGFDTGQRLPLTAHGSLGYALMCAATPRQAIEVLERFWHLRGRGVLMTFEEDEDGLFFSVAPEVAMPTVLRDFLFHSMLTSMYRAMLFMMPTMATNNEIWFESAEPAGFDATKLALPPVRFAMPRSGISLRGEKAALDAPLPTANPEAFTQAIAQCERESALLDKG